MKYTTLLIQHIKEIIPILEKQEINPENLLTELGANSIDRAELITMTLEKLQIDVPRIEFASAQTISELAELFQQHVKP